AHLRGVIHRDLKPSNILLDRENRPRVTDFGLAKRLEQDSGLTVSGQVLGTPGYMPPEQARGEAHLVGPESDVYSLGAVLYHLLTGRPPFRAGSVYETISHVIQREPDPPRRVRPDIDADLETICLRCLQKSPASRYRSAGELADELERYLRGEPIWARPVGPFERFARWCRRNPKLATATGAAVLSAAAAIVFLAVGLHDARALADTNRRQLDFLLLEKAGLDEQAKSVERRATEAEERAISAETEAAALRKRVEELEQRLGPDHTRAADGADVR
ncbi:MAG TPA: serine/threonine-protein kinase, partial [Planctomycetaceae bacterium]